MYPSKSDPAFGTFVRVFYEGLCRQYPDIKVDKAVYKGRAKNKIRKLFKYIWFYWNIIFRILTCRYDYVYVHTITYPTPALRFVYFFKPLNLIFNVHGVDVLTTSKLSKKLRDFSIPLLKACKYVVVPSIYFKNVVERELPEIIPEKIIVSASGGIELPFYQLNTPHINNNLRIGFVSRIAKGKGWDTYLKAIKILIDEGLYVSASIVGSGNQTEEMISMINLLNLNKYVKYLGSMGHACLPNYLNNIDLFIFPSENESESLGLVGLEAMASSVPVIGSNIGGISTYIEDGKNGFLFTPRCEKELATKIKHFSSLPANERIRMSNMAYETAKNYETDKVLSELFSKIFNKYESK